MLLSSASTMCPRIIFMCLQFPGSFVRLYLLLRLLEQGCEGGHFGVQLLETLQY